MELNAEEKKALNILESEFGKLPKPLEKYSELPSIYFRFTDENKGNVDIKPIENKAFLEYWLDKNGKLEKAWVTLLS